MSVFRGIQVKSTMSGLALLVCMILFLTACGDQEEDILGKDEDGKNTWIAAAVNGQFVGQKSEEDVISFLGVPYAKPPVGELRWKRAQAPDPSDEFIEASSYGNTSIQTEWHTERASYNAQSEDCLTLNIWTADLDGRKPVLVFFHGGGFGWGGTADPIYNGHNFVAANDDVIMVTANYRVGLTGLIDLSQVPGGEEYPDSANNSLLDQVQALKWVQENIEAFGGDPDNVTIFGESAGGAFVSLLMICPEAEGLFHKVIAQSGGVALTYDYEDYAALTEMLMELTEAESMDDLMALTEEELKYWNACIFDEEEELSLNDLYGMPLRDGRHVPEDPYQAFLDGAGKDIPLLVGSNADEWNYWINEVGGFEAYSSWIPERLEGDLEMMSAEDGNLVEQFLALQEEKEPLWAQTEFYNDLVFRIPAVVQAANHADSGGKSYMYYWTYPSAQENMGACHAVELSYVFNNLEDTIFTGDNPDKELAEKVQQVWANFAKTGSPSIDGFEWPEYDSETRLTVFIGSEFSIVGDPLREQRLLVEPLLKYYIK